MSELIIEENKQGKDIHSRKYVELKNLPGLKPFNIQDSNEISKIMYKSIAIQLKALNINITKLAMEDLYNIVDSNLSNMFVRLQNIIEGQRRSSSIDYEGLETFLNQFLIKNEDLVYEFDKSMYIHEYLKKTQENDDQAIIDREENEGLNFIEKQNDITQKDTDMQVLEKEFEYLDEITKLLPNDNELLNSKIPNWLPKLPPSHTYKFTNMFTKKKLNEIALKKKLVNEQHKVSNHLNNIESFQYNDLKNTGPENEQESKLISNVSVVASNLREKIYGYDIINALANDDNLNNNNNTLNKKFQSRLKAESKSIFQKLGHLENFDDISSLSTFKNQLKNQSSSLKKFDVQEYCLNKVKNSGMRNNIKKIEHLKNSNKKNPFIRGLTIQKNNKLMESFISKYNKRSYDGFLNNIVLQHDKIIKLKESWKSQYLENEKLYKVYKKEKKATLLEKLKLEKELKQQEELMKQKELSKPILINIKPMTSLNLPKTVQSSSSLPFSSLPVSTVPPTTLPPTTLPTSTLPTSTLPPTTWSGSTLPPTTWSDSTLPPTTLSAATFPISSFPASTFPVSSLPVSTFPAFNLPNSTQLTSSFQFSSLPETNLNIVPFPVALPLSVSNNINQIAPVNEEVLNKTNSATISKHEVLNNAHANELLDSKDITEPVPVEKLGLAQITNDGSQISEEEKKYVINFKYNKNLFCSKKSDLETDANSQCELLQNQTNIPLPNSEIGNLTKSSEILPVNNIQSSTEVSQDLSIAQAENNPLIIKFKKPTPVLPLSTSPDTVTKDTTEVKNNEVENINLNINK